jgi:hypothetical protein
MEPLLFADENAPEWAFSKRKGVKKWSKIYKKKSTFKKVEQNPPLRNPLLKKWSQMGAPLEGSVWTNLFQRLGGSKFTKIK